MKTFRPVFSAVCLMLLTLLGSEVSAQYSFAPERQEWNSSTLMPSIAIAMKSFDGLGGAGQAPDSLPQPLAALLGAPLADAIHQEHNGAYPHAQPIPPAIRA